MFIFPRFWREVGEQPCLWSTLKLKFLAVNGKPNKDTDGPTGWTQDLQRVLSMKRLQALQQLNLDFSFTVQDVVWRDCIRFLQIITRNSPTVRKLSLESLHLADPLPPSKVLAEQLVAKLVNFEQVDFGTDGFLRDHHWDAGDNSVANALLRRLAPAAMAAVLSSGEGSKLWVLSMPAYPRVIKEALAEARKFLTVNINFITHRIIVDF